MIYITMWSTANLTTCPAWDSLPGLLPNPPSKFWHVSTNSTALSTSIASNRFYMWTSIHMIRQLHQKFIAQKSTKSKMVAIYKRLNAAYMALHRKPIAELRSVTCHMDHTVLPVSWHRWMCPALTSAKQTGTWFTYNGGMKGWVALGWAQAEPQKAKAKDVSSTQLK